MENTFVTPNFDDDESVKTPEIGKFYMLRLGPAIFKFTNKDEATGRISGLIHDVVTGQKLFSRGYIIEMPELDGVISPEERKTKEKVMAESPDLVEIRPEHLWYEIPADHLAVMHFQANTINDHFFLATPTQSFAEYRQKCWQEKNQIGKEVKAPVCTGIDKTVETIDPKTHTPPDSTE